MRVSVLIPTLNRLPYLRLTLASALAQQGVDLEVLVSDDGSTDGTREYVGAVAASDARVRLLTDNPSPGIFENVEHLIRHATGDVYTVLGDDDLLDEEFSRRLADPLEHDPTLVLSFCDHRVIDADGRVLPRATRRSSERYGRAALTPGRIADPVRVALNGGVWLGFTLYRRSEFPSDVFDLAAGTAADWDFAIRAALRGGFYYAGGPFASYRDHRQTASRLRKRDASAAAVRVLLAHSFADPDHERVRHKMLIDRVKRHAFQFAADDTTAARQSLRLYRERGGRPSAHTLLAEAMLRLPAAAAAGVHRAATTVADAARLIERRTDR